VGATAAGTCPGTYTITGGNLITYTGGATNLAAGATCTFSIATITSSTPGIYLNRTGQISASTGTGNYGEDTLSVYYPPTIAKSFSDATIVVGGTTAMTIQLGSQNAFAITTSSAMTDTLPTSPGAMTIANSSIINNTCPFTPVDQASGALGSGDTAVRIPSGSSIPLGGCQFTVYVTANTAGTYTNTISAGALTTNAGSNAAASSATLKVVAVPPTVTKAFLPATIAAGGTSTLMITLYNPNSVPIALSSTFTDIFPTGVVTAATPNRSTTCISGTVGGTSGTLTLSAGASIPPGTSANPGTCTLQVDVTAAATGVYTNTIAAGALQTGAGNNASAVSAVLTVPASTPPTVSKAFGTTVSTTGITSTLTLTLSNTNSGPATLSANLDDTLPTNLVIATPNGLTGSCTLGSVTATAGSSLIRYASGATIPSGGCTIVVNVTSATPGTYTNTIAAGTLQTNLGNSPGPTSDILTIYGIPNIFILKSADKSSANPGEVITYTISIKNDGPGPANTVTLTDSLGNYNALAISAYSGSPFNFTEGSPLPSGLTLGTPTYSSDGGANYTYTPLVSGAGGAPAGYDGVVTNWKIIMNNNMNANGGNFTLNYKSIVK
jgi:uncharacterized repeat protein (TIGR01451 family)